MYKVILRSAVIKDPRKMDWLYKTFGPPSYNRWGWYKNNKIVLNIDSDVIHNGVIFVNKSDAVLFKTRWR